MFEFFCIDYNFLRYVWSRCESVIRVICRVRYMWQATATANAEAAIASSDRMKSAGIVVSI